MATPANVTEEWRPLRSRSGLFPCAAPTFRYSTMVTDLAMIIWDGVEGSDSEVFFSSLRVAGPGLYAFPAIVVISGKPELEVAGPDEDSVTNPKLIIEILTPETGDFKQGRKFAKYRLIPSFCEYLLVDQNRVYAEHWVKLPDGDWLLHQTTYGDEMISLESVGVRFKLKEAYDRDL